MSYTKKRRRIALLIVAISMLAAPMARADVVTDWNVKAGEIAMAAKLGPPSANRALTPDRGVFFPQLGAGRKLYLTHSGATASQVTIYKLNGSLPVFHKTVSVGFNPFGLAFVP